MENQNNVSGIISLILGILSIVWAFLLPGGVFVSLVLAIVGIVCGSRSRKNFGSNGMATCGIVFSIIAIVIFVIMIILLAVVGGYAIGSGIISSM